MRGFDYYPFGMNMPGRTFSSEQYRYGFNGKENDKDAGEGVQDYGMRVYDVRIGKFLSVDPLQKKYPDLTPYQFASNSPIANIDLDGLERFFYKLVIDSKKGTTTLTHVTTEEKAPTLGDWFASGLLGRKPKDFNGPKYPKSIIVNVYVDGSEDISFSTQFNYFKDLLEWKAAGFPIKKPTAEELKTQEIREALTEYAINEAYYNYEMSDGHFDGDVGIDISRLFRSKPKVVEKVNEPVIRANGGNPAGANANTANVTATPPAATSPSTFTLTIPKNRFPESAGNIEKSTIENGAPPSGILDRNNAANQRKANLQGIKRVKGKDRDEATPAILRPSGKVRVDYIKPSDNRGAGAYMMHQLKNVPDGTRVVILTSP